MIPAQPGYAVHFELSRPDDREPDGRHRWGREVGILAWDDDGSPLIAGDEGLINPDSYEPGYGTVDHWEVGPSETGIHVVPGGGWLQTTTLGDGTKETVPVLAWHLNVSGRGFAITPDGEGEASVDLRHSSVQRFYWHPVCSPSWDPDSI